MKKQKEWRSRKKRYKYQTPFLEPCLLFTSPGTVGGLKMKISKEQREDNKRGVQA